MMKNSNNKVAFIVNPVAKNGDTIKLWFSLLRSKAQEKYGNFMKEYITQKKLDATDYTGDAINQGYNVIVCIGGSGTQNEIINGYIQHNGKEQHVSIVIPPIITDFSRTLYGNNDIYTIDDIFGTFNGFPVNSTNKSELFCNHLFMLIDSNNLELHDVGLMTSVNLSNTDTINRYFINSCPIGFSSAVTKSDNGWSISFDKIGQVCKQLFTWKNKSIQFKIGNNDWVNFNVYQFIVANGKYSNNVCIVPNADSKDGYLDLMIFDNMSIKDIGILKDIYSGNHLNSDKVTLFINSTIMAKPVNEFDEVLVEIDGEQGGKLPTKWVTIPQAVYINNL